MDKLQDERTTSSFRNSISFSVIRAALIALVFTVAIAFGVQTVIGGNGKPSEGVVADGVTVFDITVQEWSFTPAVIKVNPGDNVKFVLTSVDVWHGFAVNELGINLAVPAGKTVTSTVTIPPGTKAGQYTTYCSVFCGLGHPYLKGRIIVGDPKLFLGVGVDRLLPYIATLLMAGMFATVILIGRRGIK